MAGHIRRAKVRPQLVLCSSAARALQTYEAISAAVGPSVPGLVEDELYGASDSDLRVRLHEVPDTVEALLVIGHNPGLQDLALGIAGDGDEHALARLGDKFPTCALATLNIPTSWADLGPGQAYLQSLALPPRPPGLSGGPFSAQAATFTLTTCYPGQSATAHLGPNLILCG